MIRNLILSVALSLIHPLSLEAAAEARPGSPNVIIILVDDLGYADTGCYGAMPQHVLTPNIDRLAREGRRFTDAHSPSSVCTPSRYSMLTGEYGFRNRQAKNILPGNAPLSIKPGTLTLPALFQSRGYITGFIGKWHLGLGHTNGIDWNGEIKPGPLELGFSSAFYMPSTGDRVPTVLIRNHRIENLDHQDPIQVSYQKKVGNEPTGLENPNMATILLGAKGHDGTITHGVSRIGWMSGGKSALWIDEELMDRLTSESVRFIEENRSSPFFLYFATHGIHEPRVPARRFVGSSGAGVYGDQIVELDASIGRVLKALDDHNLTTNTLVLVSSDNGGAPVDLGAYRYGERANLHGHIPNGPLRGGKYTTWEGGTRVPLIIRWPKQISSGSVSDALISLTDLMASFAHLLGVTLPENSALDSVDVLDALLGKSSKGRQELVEHKYGDSCALRIDNWKWIDGQLYDLSKDISEQHDIASQQPERARAMAERLKVIRSSVKTKP